MSISVSTVQRRYIASHGADPLFAPVDGANCPDAVKSSALQSIEDPAKPALAVAKTRSHSHWFTLASSRRHARVLHHARERSHALRTGSHLWPPWQEPTVSVYRRSLMAANLKYVTTVGAGVTPPRSRSAGRSIYRTFLPMRKPRPFPVPPSFSRSSISRMEFIAHKWWMIKLGR